MSALEMTRLCAEAMDIAALNDDFLYEDSEGSVRSYTPLQDDAQAIALVKTFHLHIGKTLRTQDIPRGEWFVSCTDKFESVGIDLNRAIVECVAKMQAAK